jgi:hypothetical protein
MFHRYFAERLWSFGAGASNTIDSLAQPCSRMAGTSVSGDTWLAFAACWTYPPIYSNRVTMAATERSVFFSHDA